MRAFYITNRYQDHSLNEACKEITSVLELEGIEVDTSFFISKPEIDRIDYSTSYAGWIESLKLCDLLVTEISTFSSGMGFFIARALFLRKPVLCLYNEKSKTPISTTILGEAELNQLLTLKVYNQNTINKIINNYQLNVSNAQFRRFILNLPNYIHEYLDWKAYKTKESKATIVRNAVDEKMKKFK